MKNLILTIAAIITIVGVLTYNNANQTTKVEAAKKPSYVIALEKKLALANKENAQLKKVNVALKKQGDVDVKLHNQMQRGIENVIETAYDKGDLTGPEIENIMYK